MSKLKHVTVELEFPIKDADDRPITSLTFRRMRTRDTLINGLSTEEDTSNLSPERQKEAIMAGYQLWANLAGVDIELILDLDISDLEKIADEIAPLMGESGAAALQAAKAKREAKQSPGAT